MPTLRIKEFLYLSFVFGSLPYLAQNINTGKVDRAKGINEMFSFSWGYNRSFFSKSDIHFTGPNYDFTIYDVASADRPTPFKAQTYFSPMTVSVPQYNIRLGYHFKDRWGLSFGMDHMKYVIHSGQKVMMSGVIDPEASTKYSGSYLNEEIIISKDFLEFEHTDGLNLVTIEIEYRLPVLSLAHEKVKVSLNSGVGGVWMVTRTDVKVFGDGMNNDFHIAGFTMTAKTGPRVDFFDKFFIAGECKAGYVTLPWVLLKNSAPMHADHNFSFLEYFVSAGVYFRLWDRRTAK